MQKLSLGEFGFFIKAVPVAIAIALIGYFIFKPAPPPAPSNQVVFGCYVSDNAPPITLNAGGLQIRQQGFAAIPFHLERHKQGIALTAEAPIRADKTSQGYRFGIDSRGIGRFLAFYQVQNGQVHGVFDEALLENFQMLASDGAYLNYRGADEERCASL